jgi:outer membrane protein assembly factor BamB
MISRWSFLTVLGLGCSLLLAADWPQWRGPERTGVSEETGLLQQWPEGGPKLLWQANDMGYGYSTPAVVGDRLYLLSNEGENEFVQARQVQDGKQVWSTPIGKVGHPDQKPPYPGARSMPTVDGDALYALGSDGDLVCLDLESGKPRWSKNVRTEYGGQYGEWAYSESPLIDGDVLVCTPGGREATLVALDKTDGKLIWKCPISFGNEPTEAAYASIMVMEVDGVRQYVQFLNKAVVGVETKSGKLLWQYERTAEGSPANIPTPVVREGYVYTAASRSGGGLVQVSAANGAAKAEEVYFKPDLPKNIGGSVLVGDYLYGTTSQSVMCVEFTTGEVKWQQRVPQAASSVCYADGCLYFHSEAGEVSLVKATPEGYQELGRFTPAEGPDRGSSKAWAYPVVANGRLYIRDLGSLWCYDIRAQSAE